MFKFKMGLQVKDRATGFAGVITARAEYDTGALLYLVEDEGGREVWIGEESLELCYGY